VAPRGQRGGVSAAIVPEDKLDLSVLVVARDAEGQLGDCLRSASFARDIVVVLDRCTDRSAEVARRAGARILEGAWPVEADRRNAGIALCTSPWILELDADERVSAPLRVELAEALGRAEYAHYYVPFHNYIGAVWVKHGWGAYNGVAAKPCLFRAGAKSWGGGEIHPSISLIGKGGRLTGHIDHFVDRDVAGVIRRLDRYSDAAAKGVVETGQRLYVHRTVRRFFSRFLKSYWQRRGYREGWRGVLLALFAGLYPVLTHIKALDLRERADRHV
jgi:glycosyltransferase involved in cell wall biosynthesis